MSKTHELAHERIHSYHTPRDRFHITEHPELAHTLSMRALGILNKIPVIGEKAMKQLRSWCHFPDLDNEISAGKFHLGDLNMNYPVGIAAGMFKDVSRVPWELFREGGMQVGFVTVGGITLYEQPGNAKPRHFSFPSKTGLGGDGINRYGLNNAGTRSAHDALALARTQGRIPEGIPIIANICNGATTLEKDKAWEMRHMTRLIIDQVDAIEVNISCPNQAGAQDMGKKMDLLREALQGVHEEANGKPIFLKISPDTDEATLKMIIEISRDYVSGYSSTNTTTDPTIRGEVLRKVGKSALIGTKPDEKKQHGEFTLLNGGISGNALLPKQIAMTRLIRVLAPDKAIIGIGGIGDEESASSSIVVGANALALYSRLAQDGQGALALAQLGAARAMKVIQ